MRTQASVRRVWLWDPRGKGTSPVVLGVSNTVPQALVPTRARGVNPRLRSRLAAALPGSATSYFSEAGRIVRKTDEEFMRRCGKER